MNATPTTYTTLESAINEAKSIVEVLALFGRKFWN